MGTWGTAIFSDDIAADVRDEFTAFIGEGLSGEEATERLVAKWSPDLGDQDVAPVFWIALAATQWKLGRLSGRAHAEALRVIGDGSDAKRWSHDGKLLASRLKHLAKLEATLNSPQPQPRRVRPRFINRCDWVPGELIAYITRSGARVLFRVIGFHTDAGGTSPVCEILDWPGSELPDQHAAKRLRPRARVRGYRQAGSDDQLMIGATSAREIPYDRIFRTGIVTRSSSRPGGFVVTVWRYLDRSLAEVFGIQ